MGGGGNSLKVAISGSYSFIAKIKIVSPISRYEAYRYNI
jgi:hypothetical protein